MEDSRYPQARTPEGMVSSAHYLASQAGVWMLRQGGNAVDAAVTTAATIAVVAPHLNGIGGDVFAQVWPPGAMSPVGLNASGRSSFGATIERVREAGHVTVPLLGPLTITVPGAVSAWAVLLERFGTRRIFDCIQPAVDYADHGAPVTAKLAGSIARSRSLLERDHSFRAIFFRKGEPLEEGDVFVNRDLGASLREIGTSDGEAMYRGELARLLAKGIQQAGGMITEEDLAAHRPEWVEPLTTEFSGRTVFELPPNCQGITALEMLNLAEELDVARLAHNSAEYVDTLARAMHIAYEDRERYITDPAFFQAPVETLISKPYARRRLSRPAPEALLGKASDTIYLCAVDAEGMGVSLIQSLFMGFGSGVMAQGTGIGLQNRGAFFSLDPEHTNSLQPGKRTMHTLIPGMASTGGRLELVFGSMGGDAQPQIHLQMLLNHYVFGMEIQQAIEAPRFVFAPSKDGTSRILLESRFPSEVADHLSTLGHDVDIVEGWSSSMGHAQAIRLDRETGLRLGAADPRGDGAALGY
ncbi:MAG TPA: gamma-glutamyltransferase [Chloroflexota bacterium]|nr:gamma-glutamyltransferase [Chloroflexota bacterium]